MTGALTFDSNSLQTYSAATHVGIITNGIEHTNLPAKDAALYPLANANQSVIPYVGYPSKAITIKGAIVGSTSADLDSRIDSFKQYFFGKDKNLDIDYSGTTRRYVATVNTIRVQRQQKALWAEFQVEFICTLPFGKNTAATTALNQRLLLGTSISNFMPSMMALLGMLKPNVAPFNSSVPALTVLQKASVAFAPSSAKIFAGLAQLPSVPAKLGVVVVVGYFAPVLKAICGIADLYNHIG